MNSSFFKNLAPYNVNCRLTSIFVSTTFGIPHRLDLPYVFFNRDTALPYCDIKNAFNGACRRARIKGFHFHHLHQTFPSQLVMAGVDITTVKELLGHKALTMTLRYVHLAPSHKIKAVDMLDSTINKNVNYIQLRKK